MTFLQEAARLAQKLSCPLVALCSRSANAADASEALSGEGALQLVAIDVADGFQHPRLSFVTSQNASALAGRKVDLSLKRNLALLLARMSGWHRIILLDDDILVGDHEHLEHAATLLDSFDAVGISIAHFPDNSVVCHAHKETGGHQDTFVGGGALAVAPMEEASFFPDVYNDDWFFLLDDSCLRPVSLTGSAKQNEYDPFAHPRRAWSEEFGDVLAEGIFHLLDRGYGVKDAGETFWRCFLRQRQRFIQEIIERVSDGGAIRGERAGRVNRSLNAAGKRHETISPQLCVGYLDDWLEDRSRWQDVLAKLPTGLSVDEALRCLGFTVRSTREGAHVLATWADPSASRE